MQNPLISSSILISVLLILSSCSSNVKGSWSCPVLDGGKGNCSSISEADSAKSVDNNSAILPSTTSANSPEAYSQKPQKIEINLIAPKLKDLEKIIGTFNNKDKNKGRSKDNGNDNQSKTQNNTTNSSDNFTAEIMGNHSPQNQLRTKEKIGKVWLAPYIDADGNQHSESSIYIVDEKPRWISQR